MRTHDGIPCPDDAHNLPCAACNRAAYHAEDRKPPVGHILTANEGCTCLACGGTDPVNPPDLPDPWSDQ